MTPLAHAMKMVSRAQQEEERLEKRTGIPISQLLDEQAKAKRKTADALEEASKRAREQGC